MDYFQDIFQSIILGLTQGLAEFLPISSSGHIALMQKLFGVTESTLTFSIILHLGTLIPVLVIFRREILSIIRRPFQKMTLLLIVGTIPAVVAALFLGDMLEILDKNSTFLALGFFLTGVLLLYADNIITGDKKEKDITYFDALFVGIMQAIAIAPAISRSGSTISGSLSRRFNRQTAARFSFLLSVPAILGGVVLEIKKFFSGDVVIDSKEWLPIGIGFIVAVISGFFAIRFMLKLIRECKLKYFSYYVFGLSGVILIDQIFFKLIFV